MELAGPVEARQRGIILVRVAVAEEHDGRARDGQRDGAHCVRSSPTQRLMGRQKTNKFHITQRPLRVAPVAGRYYLVSVTRFKN